MAELTLSEAAARFAASLRDDAPASTAVVVNRFVRWYGPDLPLSQLRGHQVSLYADVLGAAATEANRRADQVKSFLAYLKKEELLAANLAPHLRLRKAGKAKKGTEGPSQATVKLTREGERALQAELEMLVEQRVAVRHDIRLAMADKDFRENSPLDAAKERQGHIEARIRDLEGTLRGAAVVDEAGQDGRIRVGSTVVVKNLKTETVTRYTIVGPKETNAADGKISSESPVGKALLERGAGDEVQVSAPAGALRIRVEEVEG